MGRLHLHVVFGGAFLVISHIAAEPEPLGIQAYLPLLERNSIARKILDVTYSLHYEEVGDGNKGLSKQDAHIVFDAETGKYREEVKYYTSPTAKNDYQLVTYIWDGAKFTTWFRTISEKPGFRARRQGIYEHPGTATIMSERLYGEIPSFLAFYFDEDSRLLSKSVSEQNSKISLVDNTIIIETEWNKFEFSKKTGYLEKLISYDYDENDKKFIRKMWDFANHVEQSGVWIPLKVIETEWSKGEIFMKAEYTVDSSTLRLLDTVTDVSIFNEALPAGCFVSDEIKKRSYRVTTINSLPNDINALKQALDKMLEQAQEQKEAAEQKK